MKKVQFFILLILNQLSFAQTETLIHGKVLNDDFPVQGVKVVNIVTEKSIVTNNNGSFAILAKPGDMLVFYAIEYNYKRKSIDEKDIYDNNLIIKMDKKPVELKEVIVENNNLDAVKMGVLMKPAKEYTPAERKLRTATTGLLDPLMNLISGRTKNLKKELSVEKQEMLLAKVTNMYDNDFYTNKLKIPADYIKAFQYYIIYDDKFIASVKAKNKSLSTFRIIELAQDFNNLLAAAPKN